MRDPIRWGILGCGDVCEVKSGPGFQRAHGSALVAVMRRQGHLAADFARRHGVPRWYDDARALVHDPEVDAIYVATPPGAHVEGVALAAAAGKPVYVEKPMARHTAECDAMLAACAAAGQKLFVAYYRRALPRFLRVREILTSGVLGPLTQVSYRFATPLPANADPAQGGWRLAAATSGGGLLLDLGSHVLDLIDFFTGPIPLDTIHAHAARIVPVTDAEDTLTAVFRTAAGTPAVTAWNFAAGAREDCLEFTGTAGRLSCSVFSTETIRLETAAGAETFTFPNPPHIAQPLIQTIVDELLGRGTCPSDGASARRTNAVIDRMLEAYYGGRHDAFWTRPATWPGLRPPA
jgi:predicted dehydrogenase